MYFAIHFNFFYENRLVNLEKYIGFHNFASLSRKMFYMSLFGVMMKISSPLSTFFEDDFQLTDKYQSNEKSVIYSPNRIYCILFFVPSLQTILNVP